MLTPDQARDRAHDIVQRARAAGADAADAVFAADAALDVSIRLGKLEDIGRSESEDLGLRVFVGQRSASVSTSDLSTAAMDALVERAVAMAREAPEDPWAGLAPADRLLHGITPMLGLDDGGDVSPEQLRDAALEAEDAARAVPGVSNSEGGGASASRSVWALATSHGFAGAYAATGYGVSASVLAGEGSAMQRDYAHSSARLRAHLESPEAIGRRAGDVDDVAVVVLARRARLADPCRQLVEVVLGDLDAGGRRQERVAQVEHPRSQVEAALPVADVAEGLERQQEATRGRPAEAGDLGDLGEGQHVVVVGERPDDGQPAVERLHELAGSPLVGDVRVGLGHAAS